jgi:hypothetical protein
MTDKNLARSSADRVDTVREAGIDYTSTAALGDTAVEDTSLARKHQQPQADN